MASLVMEHIEEELICCVCWDLLNDPVILPCSHNLCKKCVQGLIDNTDVRRQSFDCPKCRHNINLGFGKSFSSLPENKALKNIISIVKEERSMLGIKKSECSKHSLEQQHYCQTCKCAVCNKCKLEEHNGFGHNIEAIDIVLADKQEKTDNSLMELKIIQKCLEDQHKQIMDEKEKLNVYVDGLLESVDFTFDQLLHEIEQKKKALTSSLQTSVRERKRSIVSEDACCKQKLSRIKMLIKQYEASQRASWEPEYRIKMMDHYFLKMCSLLTFELNSDSYEFSLKHLPHVKLQGTEDLMRALDGVTWSHDLVSELSKQCEKGSDDRQQQTDRTATATAATVSPPTSVTGNHDNKNNNVTSDVTCGAVRDNHSNLIQGTKIVKQLSKMLGSLCVKSGLNVALLPDGMGASLSDGDSCAPSHPSTSRGCEDNGGDGDDVGNHGNEASAGVAEASNPSDETADSPFHAADFFKSFSDPGVALMHPVQLGASGSRAVPDTPQNSPQTSSADSRRPASLQSCFSVDSTLQKPLFTLGMSSPSQHVPKKGRRKWPKCH